MKPTQKTTASPGSALLFLALFVTGITVLVSCADNKSGKIPVDETQARENVIPVKLGKQYQDSFISARNQLARLLTDSTFLNRKLNLPNAETFNRHAIALLLNVDSCAGIRIYMGTGEKGEARMVLVPVDKNGKDIITHLLARPTALTVPGIPSANAQDSLVDDGEVVENGQVCPPCQIGGGGGN
jgi:hypothetical protein